MEKCKSSPGATNHVKTKNPWGDVKKGNFRFDNMNKLIKKNNRGSAVVEATIVIPFFLFAMMALFQMAESKLTEADIYEAGIETAEYLAEYAYVSDINTLVAKTKYNQYLDNSTRIEKYINGGINGIKIKVIKNDEENDYITLKLIYKINISVPFISELNVDREVLIKQRAYVGDSSEKVTNEDDSSKEYVFITDNRDVYHTTRQCTHLLLSTQISDLEFAKENGYSACGFCGNKGNKGTVLITNQGNKYHLSASCSGLKRTIYRVKKSEISGMGGCLRCTR